MAEISTWFDNYSPLSRRQIAYVAGGVAVAGVGGYLIYRALASNQKLAGGKVKSKSDDVKSKGKNSASKDSILNKTLELKNRGNDMFRDGKYEDAIKFYTDAIVSCPQSQKLDLAACYQNRAAAYEKLDDYENVFNDCTEALKLNKKYLKALRRRAEAAEKLRRYKEAVQDYMKACIMEEFRNKDTSDGAGRVLSLMSEQLAKEYWETRRNKNNFYLSKTFVDEMISFYVTDPIFGQISANVVNGYATDEHEGELKGYEKAKTCLKAKQYEDIVPACLEELTNESTSYFVEASLLRGTFYVFAGDFEKGKLDFNAVLERLKDKPAEDEFAKSMKCNAYLKLALMHLHLNNFAESAECLSEAERIDPNNSDVYSQRGQLHNAMNEIAQARDDFVKAATMKPDCPYYNIQRSISDFKVAFVEENEMLIRRAVDDLERLVTRFPECADTHATYGQMLCDMQRFVEATVYLEKAIKLAPSNANHLVRRGVLDLHQKNTEAGLKRIDQALKLDPYCTLALETLAQHYAQNSDVNKMMEYYEKAMEAVKSRTDLCHLISMRETTLAQMKIAEELFIGSG